MNAPLDPAQAINFSTYEWKVIKNWLEERRKIKADRLIAEEGHDKSNMLRGAIKMIDEILLLEKQAAFKANQP